MPEGPAVYPLEQNPGYLIGRVSLSLRAGLARLFKEQGLDLTPPHWSVLNLLYHGEGNHQADLASALGKDPPNLTRILDVLEREGLARREEDPGDRRSHRIFLSDAGRDVVEALTPQVEAWLDEAFEGISPTRYRTFTAVLRQLATDLDKLLAANSGETRALPETGAPNGSPRKGGS